MPTEAVLHRLSSRKMTESLMMQIILHCAPVLKNVKMSTGAAQSGNRWRQDRQDHRFLDGTGLLVQLQHDRPGVLSFRCLDILVALIKGLQGHEVRSGRILEAVIQQ